MKKPRMKTATSGPLQPAAWAGSKPQVFTLLHIDDDPNDTELFQAAARRAKVQFAVQNVTDAEQAMAYLNGRGRYADRRTYPLPSLVLLDLKMPRATGFDVLRWIRNHPEVGSLPVVIFSGSELQDDIQQAYAGGADSYLVKPIGFNALIELVKNINAAWVAGQPSRGASLSLPQSSSGWQATSSWIGGAGAGGSGARA
ncbi:MAG TPA: response regulator [Verrucomicrobiae bacterium]|nr:response regulator [Verrucomicrobiae bacterium]